MPYQEVSGVVDLLSLVEVSGNPIVKTSLCSGGKRAGSLGGLGLKTLDSRDVVFLFLLGKGVPVVER